MKAGIQVLLVGACAAGGFVLAYRPAGELGVPQVQKSETPQPRRGDPVPERDGAGIGLRPETVWAARGAVQGADKPWNQAPKTLLELKNTLGVEGAGLAEGRLAVMEAIGKMDASELGELLANEAENPDFFRRTGFDFRFAVRRFAEIAPEKAAELWLAKAALRMQSDELLGPWAKQDPQAFAAWCLKLSPDAQKATAGALGSIAKESPEQFLVIASQLENTPSAVTAARTAMSAFLEAPKDKMDLAAAREFAARLPEGGMRTAALAQLVKWPGIDITAYPEVLNAIGALSREDGRRLGRDMADKAEVLPESPARESAFVSALRGQAEKDPTQAVKRLEALNGTADYPAAVRGFVDATARKDPAAAVQWALAIPSEGGGGAVQVQRSAALERAAGEWFKQNPEAARQWVETAPLTPQEYFQLTGRQRPQ